MTPTTRVLSMVCALGVQLIVPGPAAAQIGSLVQAAQAAAAQSALAQTFAVTSTRQDPATGQLVIVGSGFKADIAVAINGARLRVVSVLGHEVRAELPTLLPGTYRLLLDQRRGGPQRFVVTVGLGGTGLGAPGPMGPQGPMGPMGQMGQMGPAGLNGPAGAQGLQGAAGAAGPAGAMGPAGPAGATGAAGPAGAAGPMGPLGATGAPGVAGPQGPQGLQGLQGLAGPTGAAGGFTVVAANGNTLGTVLSFGTSGQPSLVALQNNGVWLAAPVNPDGIVPMSFYALYADDACATPPFLPFDTNPAPFFRLLQTVNPGDTAGFYAGNAAQVQTFRSLSVIGQPGQCLPTAGSGWDLPLLAGPMRRVDLATVPAPFVVR